MNRSQQPIRVLIVEDSPTQRLALCALLEEQGWFEVAADVTSAEEALALIDDDPTRFDVISLDMELPGIDGLTFVERIMQSRPIPIVVTSASWHDKNPEKAFAALQAGAIACVEKPACGEPRLVEDWLRALRVAAGVPVVRRYSTAVPPPRTTKRATHALGGSLCLIAIGASLGGPQAVVHLLKELPRPLPVPVLLAQHLAPGFVDGFARWLEETTGLRVIVVDRDQPAQVPPGAVAIPAGSLDLVLTRCDDTSVEVSARPSQRVASPVIDVLWRSLLEQSCPGVVVLLTGTGTDGSETLEALDRRGATIFIQDPDDAMAPSMPEAAVRKAPGAIVAPLNALTALLSELIAAETFHRKGVASQSVEKK
ncbi:MAG: response regulator [Candidatus Dadabacteria bacterium]|nr:MAG: response regulator [Candidatus Dadabacteria bacterium]